jgi:fumarylpyruvate hydrolase
MNSVDFLFPPPAISSVEIRGSNQRYAANRIFCVGRNYHAHAKEMGVSVDKSKQEPFYFTKSPSAIVASGSRIPYPPETSNFHHEMELVLAIGKEGFQIPEADAYDYIFGYAAGLDMTRRDLQLKARDSGRPWDLGKDVEQSAVISPLVPAHSVGRMDSGQIRLEVNGQERQSSDLSLMIWSIPEILAHLSRFYHLQPGDLIYTGTPEGVGAVNSGDRIVGSVARVGTIELEIS